MKQILAIVSDAVLPFHKGGKENRLYEISKRLVNDETEVHIYTMKWWDGPQTIEHEGMYYHALCKRYPMYTESGRRSIVEAIMFGLATFKMLFKRFDVLDVDQMPFYPIFSARVVCWLRRKKLYVTWHEVWGRSYWLEYMKGPMGIFGFITEWIAFRLPDVIISNSTHTTECLIAAGVTKEIVTVPLGVDVKSIRSADISEQKSDVICIGRFLSHKNILVLIDAIALVRKQKPDTSLLIIGNGPEKGNIIDRIAMHNLEQNVSVRTDVETDAEKNSLLKASTMLVLPSDREGFGLVIVEANAAGIPAITVNVPGNAGRYLIDEGVNGMLAEVSAEDLAKKITHILTNRALFNPEEHVTEYDIEEVVKKIQETYSLSYSKVSGKMNSEKKFRVCVVTPYFYPRIGGMEMYAHNLAKRLQESGKYIVSIITSNDTGTGYTQDTVDGMKVHRLPIAFIVSNTPLGWNWYSMIKKIYAIEKPDIIHMHTPVVGIADIASAAAGNIPTVVTYHAGSMKKGKWPIDILIGLYESLALPKLLNRSKAVGAVYPQFLQENFPSVVSKMAFLPVGVDLKRFSPTALPTQQTVLFVGRIERTSVWKGVDQLIEAMALVHKELPDARLELIGGGDALEDHRAHAQTLGIADHVIFHGAQTGQKVVDAYQRASVFILPSTSDSEAFPTVMVEAMASGRPIVASRVGGVPNVITDGSEGLLVPPSNPKELARAIIRVLTDRALAEHLAQQGVIRSQGFAWENRLAQYEAIYSQILADTSY